MNLSAVARRPLAALALLLAVYGAGAPAAAGTAAAEAGSASSLAQLESAVASALAAREALLHVEYTGSGADLSSRIKDVIRRAIAHDDYTAYIVDSYFYSIRTLRDKSRIRLTVNYRETPEQSAEVDRQVRDVLAWLIKPGMNDHQKVKAIHDWIVLRLAYDTSLARYTAFDALSTGEAVCQGYALLAYKMLNAAGLPARIVEGKVDTGDHAWNLVRIGGSWYHLDATWNDPVPDRKGTVRYAYYLKTDDEMRRDHTWTRTYPAAATSYEQAVARAASADPQRAGFYSSLDAALGWKWRKPEHTADSPAALHRKLKQAAADGEPGVKLRYTRGKSVAADLKEAAQGVPGIRGYEASYSPFGEDGDVLLDVAFVRQQDKRG